MNNLIGLSGKKGSGKDLVTRIIQIIDFHPELNTKEILNRIDDTDYDYIDSGYKNKKFAYKLKKITCDLTGISMKQLEDPKYKGMTVSEFTGMDWSWEKEGEIVDYTFREWLQLIGTEGMRNIIHPDIWVKSLFADYNEKSKWVISDTRFPNEANAIKNRGGIVIRISRPYEIKVGDQVHSIHTDDIHTVIEIVNERSVRTDWEKENPRGQLKSDLTPIHLYDQHFSETALDDYDNFDYVIKNDGTIEDLIEKIREIL